MKPKDFSIKNEIFQRLAREFLIGEFTYLAENTCLDNPIISESKE